MAALTFGSLFAGIGGLDLGLERSGMECRWQVEIDEHAQKILGLRGVHRTPNRGALGALGGDRRVSRSTDPRLTPYRSAGAKPQRFPMTWDQWICSIPIERFYDDAEMLAWMDRQDTGPVWGKVKGVKGKK